MLRYIRLVFSNGIPLFTLEDCKPRENVGVTFQYLNLQFLVLVDGTCLSGCKFEGSHPVVCGQLFIVLVPSLHNI